MGKKIDSQQPSIHRYDNKTSPKEEGEPKKVELGLEKIETKRKNGLSTAEILQLFGGQHVLLQEGVDFMAFKANDKSSAIEETNLEALKSNR